VKKKKRGERIKMRKKGSTVWLLTSLFLMVMMVANVAVYAESDAFRSVEEPTSKSVPIVYNEEALKLEGIQVVIDENSVITRDDSTEIIVPTQGKMIDAIGTFPDNDFVSNMQDEINWDLFLPEYNAKERKAEIVVVSLELREYDAGLESPDYYKFQSGDGIGDYGELMEDDGLTSSSPRSLPDLAITTFTLSQPHNTILQALAPTTISFGIANYGPVAAHNVMVGVYENNSFMGMANFGTIPGNSSWTATMHVSGGPGGFKHGTHMISVVADPTNLIAESNKNNNSHSRIYTFVGKPDLQVTSLLIPPFVGSFTTMQPLPYKFSVRNDGNAPSANNSPANLIINGDLIYTFSMPWLDPGNSITYNFTITYYQSSNYTVIVLQRSFHQPLDRAAFLSRFFAWERYAFVLDFW